MHKIIINNLHTGFNTTTRTSTLYCKVNSDSKRQGLQNDLVFVAASIL